MIYHKKNARYAREYAKNMHAKLAPFFDAGSLRTVLYPEGEYPHDGSTPVETDDTRAIADQLNALLANPQDDPIQLNTVQA